MLLRILIAAVLLIISLCLPLTGWLMMLYFLVPYLIVGWDVLYKAIRNIANGQIFDENFLMALATIGAFLSREYSEAVFVMLFYQLGELFQNYAVNRSRESIAELMDIRPDTAHIELEDGTLKDEDPEDVEVGTIILVKPGERVPLDGIILEGSSTLDTAALTGESLPREVKSGDTIISGCVNQSGVLRIQVTCSGDESTVARILELVENAGEKKAVSEKFITRFARYYTPCVVIAAAALAAIPPLLLGNWGQWFHRALIFLVVSCPCALVISVPLSFFGGIGGAAKRGILVKGGNYLEALAKTEIITFDKTGTLTQGTLTVTDIQTEESFSQKELLRLAVLTEHYSNHPVAISLCNAYQTTYGDLQESEEEQKKVEEIAGHGIRAIIDGQKVCVGNWRLMEKEGIKYKNTGNNETGATVYVSVDGVYAGRIMLSDQIKSDAKTAVNSLRQNGIRRTVMLTGDAQNAAAIVASELNIDEFHAELLPEDKMSWIEKLLEENKKTGASLAFVGDGVNDAPVLARADIGIAMGAFGSDAAIEAADIVLMDDSPSKIVDAIRISRKTLQIVQQNIIFALTVKGIVLILGALGLASMWAAVFADVGVAFLAILNAMRCLHI